MLQYLTQQEADKADMYVNTKQAGWLNKINTKSTQVWLSCLCRVTACQQKTFNYLAYINQNDKQRPQMFTVDGDVSNLFILPACQKTAKGDKRKIKLFFKKH